MSPTKSSSLVPANDPTLLFVRGFDRPNLHYAVERVGGGDEKPART